VSVPIEPWPTHDRFPSYFGLFHPPKPVPPHFSWKHHDGMFVGECKAFVRAGLRMADLCFEAIVTQASDISGWQLRIVTGGGTIHLTEHGSRIAACRAADRALTRAIALRSVDIEPRKRT